MLDQNYLRNKFNKIRQQSIAITKPLETEDFVAQPVSNVSPPKWHLAHTSWFFEEFILKPYKENYQVFHPTYAYLFNSYYQGAGDMWQREKRGWITRPTVDDIMQYRNYVDQQFDVFLQEYHGESVELQKLIELGFNHEQQHQELLIYDIKFILGHNPIYPVYKASDEEKQEQTLEAEWLDVDCGKVDIGYDGDYFCFDNEKKRHHVFLSPYSIMSRLVTNEEFLDFIKDDGYKRFELWLDDGWSWVQENKIGSPLYWRHFDETWYEYHLDGLKPLNMQAPVMHVSYYEAEAFARWKGLRLPTEAEWEVAANVHAPEIPDQANLANRENFKTLPAQTHQFFGDVWEWTGSAYLPYPGFKIPEGTVGEYNGKFMINQMVLRGGSSATPRDHIRSTYRNFFYPGQRWMYSGFRLAK